VPGKEAEKPQQVRSEPTPQPAAKTATVAVSPTDALRLVLAEDKGKIRLALRKADDKETPQVAVTPAEDLLNPAMTSASAPVTAAAPVAKTVRN
jgi:Flp pilus assembly protein CpaB